MTSTELSKKLGISAVTLRSWERHFSDWLGEDYKEGKNFSREAVQKLAVIHYLIVERSFTVVGAMKEIERRENMDGDQVFLIEKLQSLRNFLLELKAELD